MCFFRMFPKTMKAGRTVAAIYMVFVSPRASFPVANNGETARERIIFGSS